MARDDIDFAAAILGVVVLLLTILLSIRKKM